MQTMREPSEADVTTGRLSYLPGPHNLVLRRSEFCQREGAAAVEFLSADAHLGAEAELGAISKTSRSVPVNCSRIHSTKKLAGVRLIARHNRIRVPCRIAIDVGNRLIHIRDNAPRHAQAPVFFIQ